MLFFKETIPTYALYCVNQYYVMRKDVGYIPTPVIATLSPSPWVLPSNKLA